MEDITAASACELTTDVYADTEWTQLIETYTVPCPPGTVVQSFPTTEAEALASGLLYVVLTGDPAVDEAAVAAVEAQLLAPDDVVPVDDASNEAIAAGPCRSQGYATSYSFQAFSPAATIYGTLYWWRSADCTGYLDRVADRLSVSAALYWRWTTYSRSYSAPGLRGMGCVRLSTSSYTYYYEEPGWHVYLPGTFEDHVINDRFCTANGTTYKARVAIG